MGNWMTTETSQTNISNYNIQPTSPSTSTNPPRKIVKLSKKMTIPNYTEREKEKGEKLVQACDFSKLNLIKGLIEEKAPIDYINYTRKSVLYNSVCNRKLEVISLLLDSKADINLKFDDDDTCLLAATRVGNNDVLDILLRYNIDVNKNVDIFHVNPIHSIVYHRGKEYYLERYLELGFDCNMKNSHNLTPLHYCVHSRDAISLATLLDKGAHLDVNVRDKDGNTPLLLLFKIHSLISGHDCLILLISHFSNPSIQDNYGNDCFSYLKSIDNAKKFRELLMKQTFRLKSLKMFCLCLKRKEKFWIEKNMGHLKLPKYLKNDIMKMALKLDEESIKKIKEYSN
eukprot:TRINITY_DN2215_c0_g1_i1.p1 TRINITY_DN2215_c0_g1~~TRINITY_DN2215_c0_g1_i1.p1  ORF type:complete len:342 (+),score=74.29 TRINITY_DN2215_c0_g1_i1:113-1138(+)